MNYQNDHRDFLDVLTDRRTARLPINEHIIGPLMMKKILSVHIAGLIDGDPTDRDEYFRDYCRFFKEMTYDTVSLKIQDIR